VHGKPTKHVTKPLYAVFCDLESQLADEFDFIEEAASMEHIYNIISEDDTRPSNIVKLWPISTLVSRRILLMEYLKAHEDMLCY
jgi:aarF domain-containing kinase